MITITWEESRRYTSTPDPDDNWDRGNTYTSYSDLQARYFKDAATRPSMGGLYSSGDAFDVDALPGSVVFVVVADYNTGDTFGRDENGRRTILDVFTDYKDAIALQSVAQAATDFTVKFNDKDYYIDWNGYFESLNDVIVETLVVRA